MDHPKPNLIDGLIHITHIENMSNSYQVFESHSYYMFEEAFSDQKCDINQQNNKVTKVDVHKNKIVHNLLDKIKESLHYLLLVILPHHPVVNNNITDQHPIMLENGEDSK